MSSPQGDPRQLKDPFNQAYGTKSPIKGFFQNLNMYTLGNLGHMTSFNVPTIT